MKLRLGRDDVNPDKPNISSRTPPYYAARDGYERVVKILLRLGDVSPK